MSPLASEIYSLLVAHLRNAPEPLMTYSDLVARIPSRSVNPRSPALHAALGEIVSACRTKRVPAIAAIVVTAKFGKPGGGYYPVAHPGVSGQAQEQAWRQELQSVLAARAAYPGALA